MSSCGVVIRASRLGFHKLPGRRQGWLRIEPQRADGSIRCEFAPLDGPIPGKPEPKRGDTSVCWWDDDGGESLLALSPVLRSIVRVNKPFTIVIGDDGVLR